MRGIIAVEAPPTCGEISTFARAKSGCPSGSGSGSVTSSAKRSRPDCASARIASVSATLPRAMLTRSAPSGSGGEEGGVDEPGRRLVQRHADDDDLGGRQQLGQLVDAVDPPGLVVARAARDARELDLERREPVLDGRADAAVADEQHAAVGEALVSSGGPTALGCRADEVGDAPLGREHERERELGGGGLVHARRVREHVTRRQGRGDVVVADGLRLHEADVDAVERTEPVGRAHVRRHHDVDAPSRRRSAAARRGPTRRPRLRRARLPPGRGRGGGSLRARSRGGCGRRSCIDPSRADAARARRGRSGSGAADVLRMGDGAVLLHLAGVDRTRDRAAGVDDRLPRHARAHRLRGGAPHLPLVVGAAARLLALVLLGAIVIGLQLLAHS